MLFQEFHEVGVKVFLMNDLVFFQQFSDALLFGDS